MEIWIPFIFLVIVTGLFTFLIADFVNIQSRYCNSNYNRKETYSELQLDTPEYKVVGIEQCYCKNMGKSIAKYKLWNFYLKKIDSVGHQELILYDEIGKYNIGDVLVFTLKQKDEGLCHQENDASFEDWYYKGHKEYKGKGLLEQVEPDRFDYEHTNIAQKDFACDPWANSFYGDVIITSYIKLKEILGNPEREYNFDHQKQHYEFKKFTDKDVPFSLYDWKIPAFAPNENVEWHIATHTPDESKEVLEYLNTLLKDDRQSLCNEKSHT